MKSKIVIYLFLLLLITTSTFGFFSFFKRNKLKPGDVIELNEYTLLHDEQTYQIQRKIVIRTDKGNIEFGTNYYVVSQGYISQNDQNQNELIELYQTAINLKKQNTRLQTVSYASIAVSIILTIFLLSIFLKRKKYIVRN